MARRNMLREQDERVYKFMIGAPIAVIGMLIFGLVIVNALYGRPEYKVGLYDAAHPVTSVSYRGQTFKPVGGPVSMPDTDMVSMGTSDQGYYMYVSRQEAGGGGGRPEFGGKPHHFQQVYLRTQQGQYQPVQQQGQPLTPPAQSRNTKQGY